MNIAIQASDLDHSRIDGTRVYLSELLYRFGKLAPEEEFTLYHQRAFNQALTPPHFSHYREKKIPFPWGWMQTRFAWTLFKDMPEKLFLPIQAAPFFVRKATEVIVTVHDLAFKYFPETFPRKDLWKLNCLLNWAVKRADKIMAVSHSTKKDLIKFFPELPPKRIRVIHHGFSSRFEESLEDTLLQEKLHTFHLASKSYVLFVGALQPRKNLIRLIEAFNRAKEKIPEMKLVLAGERAWLAEGIFEAQAKSPFQKDILFTGQVSFETLQALYQGARFFAFPSLYEGFGIPLLEAFASHIPVLTGRNSSLLEVGGEAVLFCNAENVSDMAAKMENLWINEGLQKELVEKGKEQLGKFSWEKCAKESLDYILEKRISQ